MAIPALYYIILTLITYYLLITITRHSNYHTVALMYIGLYYNCRLLSSTYYSVSA